MAENNLALQLIVLVLLIVSIFVLLRRRKYRWHGNVQLVAVMIVVLMLAMHMAPAYLYVVLAVSSSANLVATLGLVHGLIGIAALVPSIWLVADWAYAKASDLSFCAPKKPMMIAIICCWLAALVLGLIYYPTHLIFG